MKGLELARAYWEEYGKPLFTERFPELMPYIAAGLAGSGSECYGYDDGLSADHDFEPGFCIFLPGEELVGRHAEFGLERAYRSLPADFEGYHRSPMNPAGGARHGVFRTKEWFARMTGIPGTPSGWEDFLSVPESALAEALNGEVFYDGYGEFSAIRNAWLPPRDVVLKKLCGLLITMSQAGEYNYPRCAERGDSPAACLAADEFVRACAGAALWTESRPAPYYKWLFRALSDVPNTASLKDVLGRILLRENISENIALACNETAELLKLKGFASCQGGDLQRIALNLNDSISDASLRNISPLAAVRFD